MPLERNNVVNSFKADPETRLENDKNKDVQPVDKHLAGKQMIQAEQPN